MSDNDAIYGPKKEESRPLLVESEIQRDADDGNEYPSIEREIESSSDCEKQRDDGRGIRRSHHPNALSSSDAIIHLLKGNIGTGILAIPTAFQNSGLIFGVVGLIFMTIICVYCMHKIISCSHELSRRLNRSSMTYPEVAEYSFTTKTNPALVRMGPMSRVIIKVFLCIAQLGFCCVYLLFISQHLSKVFSHIFGDVSLMYYFGVLVLPTFALCSVRNLKYLSPISMLANLLQFVALGLSFFYLLQDIPQDWDGNYYFSSWKQLPLYFGTAMYAFEGIGVVLPLENQMRYPDDLKGCNGVLNTSMTIVSCLYIAVGFFGYLRYGNHLGDGSITLKFPGNEWLAQIIFVMFCLAIFFSYALQFYVPLKILLPIAQKCVPEPHHLKAEFALRYSMVLLTFGLASAIPKLDLLISLVGAVSSSTLALMAPAILDTVTFWPHMGPYRIRLVGNIFIFLVGFIGFLTGTYVSIEGIINSN